MMKPNIPLLALVLAQAVPAVAGPSVTGAAVVGVRPGPMVAGGHFAAAPRRVSKLMAPGVPAFQVNLPPTITPPDPTPTALQCDEVGYIRPAEPGLVQQAAWQRAPDGGFVRKLGLTSAGAKGLRIQFRGAPRASGAQVRAYVPGGTAVFGPLDPPTIEPDGTWWSPVVFGDSLGLEFCSPPGRTLPARLPEIAQITYLYTGLGGGGVRRALDCERDVTCYSEWNTEKAAVAKMLFNCTATSCSACTGSLLNRDNGGDGSPIFLTANHCINTQSAASSLTTIWNYETPTCNGVPPDPNTLPQTTGALLLKNDPFHDCSLVGLAQQPPSPFFLGWNAGGWGYGDLVTGIHHPGGEFKRIAIGTLTDSGIRSFTGFGDISVWFVDWSRGTTEPGSSGSPLFDSQHNVRAPLTGGDGTCGAQAYYGRFDLAYPVLQPYLADIASPMYVDRGYTGEEKGTSGNPFNTVYEASFAVRAGDTVRISSGSYPERETLWRPMTLASQGGLVSLGG